MAAARSRRSRKRHVQQLLFRHGGTRKGAGRKPKSWRAGTSHETRPAVAGKQALHVVLRVVPEVGNMRRREMYKAVRSASVVAAARQRIRIVHLSIQRTHLHLLVEAENNELLARGMQGFQISVARNVNTALGKDKLRRRRGRVFADRYHVVVITTPRRARNVLSYVLNNWRKHGEDRSGVARTWLLDPFSSGVAFRDWHELGGGAPSWTLPSTYEALVVVPPRSWLLREGWKRSGAISLHETPSQRP
jgi:phage-related protein